MLEAYAAVERSYSAGQFDQALAQAEGLIAQLPRPEDQPMRLRLELLVGHCCLYGLAQPQRAAERYRLVAEQSPEAVLREIALQGLERCEGGQANPPSPPPQGQPAMPWLQQEAAGTPNGAGAAAAAGAMPWVTDATGLEAEERQSGPAAVPEVSLSSISETPDDQPLAVEQTKAAQAVPSNPSPPAAPAPEELVIPELVSEDAPANGTANGRGVSSSVDDDEDLTRCLLLVEL